VRILTCFATLSGATDLAKQMEIAFELQRLLYEVVLYVNFGQRWRVSHTRLPACGAGC